MIHSTILINADLKSKVLEIMSRYVCVAGAGGIGAAQDTLEYLGLNSLKFINIVVELEYEFDFEFDDEYLDNFKFSKIEDIIRYISKKIE
ncbi:hypothetical protein GCM10008014_39050 [Paenibacillus silvae]|uniref:Carrier domain-containing protein n=1 Tax=Paenibacillus silvae TaxID=1325358 RepID=A0ABQ1ZEZ1_9BACL|nr:acyl carrier protein [Paenibacillus silvae]GGH62524.1 hypothetical protein GCM10008014_39050 [Paenibacillus silvae]